MSLCACRTLVLRTSLCVIPIAAPRAVSSAPIHYFYWVAPAASRRAPGLRSSYCNASTDASSAANHAHFVDDWDPEGMPMEDLEKLLTLKRGQVTRFMKMERKLSNGTSTRQLTANWFPYLDEYKVGDTSLTSAQVLEALDPYIMETRKDRFRNSVNNRTYSLCLVIEGLSDVGNASAIFRSADALGFQSVHVIAFDCSKRFRDSRNVSVGAEKWLDIELWDSTKECFDALKSRGYRVAATHVGSKAVSVYDVDWSCPTAIVVGNETRGISEEAVEMSDMIFSIPMRGMVESFNVSVASALIMHHALCDRTSRLGSHGDLTPVEQQILVAEFSLRHSCNAISIVREHTRRKASMSNL